MCIDTIDTFHVCRSNYLLKLENKIFFSFELKIEIIMNSPSKNTYFYKLLNTNVNIYLQLVNRHLL